MIKVSVLYPNEVGKSFNMDCYLATHVPIRLLPACKDIMIDHGLQGATTGTPAAYTVMAHPVFDSVDAFQAGFEPHAAEIMADIPNFTAVQPMIQISEVL
jgi:uncharacterized protein (TIGR02118 family)